MHLNVHSTVDRWNILQMSLVDGVQFLYIYVCFLSTSSISYWKLKSPAVIVDVCFSFQFLLIFAECILSSVRSIYIYLGLLHELTLSSCNVLIYPWWFSLFWSVSHLNMTLHLSVINIYVMHLFSIFLPF